MLMRSSKTPNKTKNSLYPRPPKILRVLFTKISTRFLERFSKGEHRPMSARQEDRTSEMSRKQRLGKQGIGRFPIWFKRSLVLFILISTGLGCASSREAKKTDTVAVSPGGYESEGEHNSSMN